MSPVIRAVAFHQHPGDAADVKFSTLTAVHAADAIASEGNPFPINRDVQLDSPYLTGLGMESKEEGWRAWYAELLVKPAEGEAAGERKNPVC